MTVPEPLETKINRIFMQNLIVKLRFAQRALHPSNAGVCVSLLQAGYAAAPAALSYEPLKSLWVDGNTAKAAQVAKVFTLAMLSRYLSLPRQGRPEGDGAPEPERRDWIEFMLSVFNDNNPGSVDYYLRLDRQHQLDQSGKRRHIFFLSDALFFTQALHALGAELKTRLEAAELPIEDYTQTDLANRGVSLLTSGVHESLVDTITSIFYSMVMPRVDWRG